MVSEVIRSALDSLAERGALPSPLRGGDRPGPSQLNGNRIIPKFVSFALAAFLAANCVPAGAEQTAAKPANIDRNGVLILVRSSLIALDQANKTGNYTVLRDLAAPAFQSNTAARLAEIFAGLRRDKIDLVGVAALEPQLTLLPQIEANGLMHMTGFFPSVPSQVNFDLAYAPVDGQWRLFGISVGLDQSAPKAPAPPPAALAKPSGAPQKFQSPPLAPNFNGGKH
jgi:hypothetical protein